MQYSPSLSLTFSFFKHHIFTATMEQLEAMKRYVKSNSGNGESTLDHHLHGEDALWTQRLTSPTCSKNHRTSSPTCSKYHCTSSPTGSKHHSTTSPTCSRHHGTLSPTCSKCRSTSSQHSTSSPTGSKHHDQDEHSRKSVLSKVKEKARKLRHSLSGNRKKNSHDDSCSMPTLGASLDNYDFDYPEEEEEDSEYYGAPMYESEKAPQECKDFARLHPREDYAVISEKHILTSSISPRKEVRILEDNTTARRSTESPRFESPRFESPRNESPRNESPRNESPRMFTSRVKAESVRTKKPSLLEPIHTNNPMTGAPASLDAILNNYRPMSESHTPEAVNYVNSAITESNSAHKVLHTNKALPPPEGMNGTNKPISDSLAPLEALNVSRTMTESVTETLAPEYNKVSEATHSVTEMLAPAYNKATEATHMATSKASEATNMTTSKIHNMAIATSGATSTRDENSEQKYDKGVSVKEYLKNKFEPGEEEKALSEVISEAISPTKKPGDKTVVEKVRGVVSSLLASNESSLPAVAKRSAEVPALTKKAEDVRTVTNKSLYVPEATQRTHDVSYSTYIAPSSETCNEITEERVLQTN